MIEVIVHGVTSVSAAFMHADLYTKDVGYDGVLGRVFLGGGGGAW